MPNFSLSDAVFENAAAKYTTPFHLYDEAGIRRNARTMKQAFAWCEDFEEYFAIPGKNTGQRALYISIDI